MRINPPASGLKIPGALSNHVAGAFSQLFARELTCHPFLPAHSISFFTPSFSIQYSLLLLAHEETFRHGIFAFYHSDRGGAQHGATPPSGGMESASPG